MKINRKIIESQNPSLTFDDVLLKPAYSEVLPSEVQTKTKITKNITIEIPIISAAMDTVTESRLAIAMAQSGGIGCIHKNLSIKEQSDEVRKVKKFESGIVLNPVTINPNQTLGEALNLMNNYGISGIPVVKNGTNKLVGILTNRDVRFATDKKQLIKDLMTKDNEGKIWIPSLVNLPQQGMVFANGPSKENWGWAAVKAVPVTKEEAEKYPIPGKKGEYYSWRMDMSTLQNFHERDFMDALSYIGVLPE